MFEELKSFQKQVDRQIDLFFDDLLKSSRLTEEITLLRKYTLRGGKRLRPYLLCLAYELYSGPLKYSAEVLKFSAALELVHTALLIHDDIIDQDHLRRGQPSFHVLPAQPRLREKSYHFSFKQSRALFVGDLLSSQAFYLMLQTKIPRPRKLRTLRYLTHKSFLTGLGQMAEIDSENDPTLTEKEVAQIERLKTSAYTTEASLGAGAILAGAKPVQLVQLESLAQSLGLAFQIKDDLLDIQGSTAQIGKPTGSDLQNGRPNYIIQKFHQSAPLTERKKFQKYQLQSQQNFRKITRIPSFQKAIRHAQTLQQTYLNLAQIQVKNINFPSPTQRKMTGLIEFLNSRKK